MQLNREDTRYKKWLILYFCGMLLIMAASALAPAAIYIWRGFYNFGYRVLAVLLIAFYYYFIPREDKPELKLIKLFCIWLALSRVLNGDKMLSEDGMTVLNIWISCMFLPLFTLIPGEKRLRLFDYFALFFGLFFTFSAIFGIYTAVTHKFIIDPLTESFFCDIHGNRIYIFDTSPNITGSWMYIAIFLFIYEIIRRKNWILKILCLIGSAVCFTALALTASRSSMLGFSLGMAALGLMLILRYAKLKKNWAKAVAVIICLGLITPLAYKSFDIPNAIVGAASSKIVKAEEEERAQAGIEEESFEDKSKYDLKEADMYLVKRGYGSSERIAIYTEGIKGMFHEPLKLLRGSMDAQQMDYINSQLDAKYGHCHNSFLQSLLLTGLPGFILTLGFCVLLVIRAFVLFFSEDPRADLALKSLVIILPGYLVHNMLETSAFYVMDIRAILFMVISGAVIAFSYEICPPKGKII